MAYLNGVLFRAASSGTGDFVVSTAIQGYQTPAAASAVNATTYGYRAESDDLTQWEYGTTVYTVSGTSCTRVVIGNSSGTTSKISFTAAPKVGFVELASQIADAGSLVSGTVGTARLGSGTASASTFLAGDSSWKAIVSTGRVLSYQKVTSTGTVTIPTGATGAIVRQTGGCGGGGTNAIGTGPGAGAGSLEKFYAPGTFTPGLTLAATIGASGVGNTGGGTTTLASGTQSISTLTTTGGASPNGSQTATSPGGASGGDVNVAGQPGFVANLGCAGVVTGFGAIAGLGLGTGSNPGNLGAGTAGFIEIWWLS